MGAWGTGSFENDDAADWLAELESEGLDAIRDAIQTVLHAEDAYLELPEASAAVAAAEVLAALRGRPADDLPESVTEWVESHRRTPDPALVRDARRAVARVLDEDSELAEVHAEGADEDGWRALMQDLESRLA